MHARVITYGTFYSLEVLVYGRITSSKQVGSGEISIILYWRPEIESIAIYRQQLIPGSRITSPRKTVIQDERVQ